MVRRLGQLFGKKCLISRRGTKNRPCGVNLQLLPANYHGSAFGSTFGQKVAKTAPFREKARKIVDLAKTWKFFEEPSVAKSYGEHLVRKFQKVPHFARKHEISSIWPNLATFSRKLPWFVVWVNFSAKSCKKCLTLRKSKKNRLFFWKLATSSSKLPWFGVCVNFSAKGCKNCSISWKSTKNRRFGQNLQLLGETTMVLRLGELFVRKLQKVPHLAIKHEKSSIWPKLATFSRELAWLGVMVNFWAESCKKCLISRKSTKDRGFGQNLQLFPANYHGSAFGSTLRQKVAKPAHFAKKHEKSSI